MRIYLTGFMGSGKTVIGRALAERLDCPFVDLDGEIELAAGASVREIFESWGEADFRRRERAALEGTLALAAVVVATGGGTLTLPSNAELISGQGLTVWLNPPFAAIVRRIGALGKLDRPLFRDERQALELYRQRLPAYQRADLRVDIGAAERPEEIATRIALLLRSRVCAT